MLRLGGGNKSGSDFMFYTLKAMATFGEQNKFVRKCQCYQVTCLFYSLSVTTTVAKAKAWRERESGAC